MKAITIITYIAVAILTTSCNAEPKGMNRKIDASSDDAAKKSVEKITTELAPTDLQRFTEAYGKLAMRWVFSNAFSENKADSKEFLTQINGKTPQEIIQLGDALESEGAPASKPATPAATPDPKLAARINIPFNMDGVEVLITGFRIAKLQKIEREFSFGSVPEKLFLIATVALKNTTEGTIIQLQNIWGDATVTDNFGNVYESPDSLFLDRGLVQGAISSRAFKPGEVASDLMIFDVPLDNAQKFTLSCDPNFWRPSGNNRLQQLSNKAFQLEFTRAELK